MVKNWMQKVDKSMERKGTVGAFTRWCNDKGYKSVHKCAQATKDKYKDQKWKRASNPRAALRDYRRATLALVFEKAAKKKHRR